MTSVQKYCVLLASILFGFAQTGVGDAQEAKPPLRVATLAPRVTVQEPRIHKELAIYPLTVASVADTSRYKHLDTAVTDRSVKITEWRSGTVPHLKVTNGGNSKVFIMAGEIMTGAKQDRMSAHDVLLRPWSGPIKLPVYCVEHGRWVMQSQQFAAGRTAGTKRLRQSAVAKSSQSRIWSDVAAKTAESGVRSSTGTMQAVYNSPEVKRRIQEYQQAFADLPNKAPNMVGFVVAVRGQIDTADLFANPPLLRGLWKKFVKAAATDAVTSQRGALPTPSVPEVQAFVGLGLLGNAKRIKTPGLGKEYLIQGDGGVTGSTLIHQERMVHLALFAPDRSAGPRELRNGIRYDTPQSRHTEQSDNKATTAPWRTPGKQRGNPKKGRSSGPQSKSRAPSQEGPKKGRFSRPKSESQAPSHQKTGAKKTSIDRG
jgi:hypothetical protein